MHFVRQAATALALLLLAGCATHTEGVVLVGPQTYTITDEGNVLAGGANVAVAAVFEQANAKCKEGHLHMLPITGEAESSIIDVFTLANGYTMTFRCVPGDQLAR